VEADVRNVSQREGDEVVELYLSFPKSPAAPIHALRGFTRMRLGTAEAKHVLFALDARDLSEVNEKGDRIVASGAYRISVGGGQPGSVAAQAETAFRINVDQRLPD